jgi:predicted nucleotidyltransferase
MRVTSEEIGKLSSIICSMVAGNPSVRIYGSRLDNSKKGGDLDLLIESDHSVDVFQQADLKMALEAALELPVDLFLLRGSVPTVFQQIALQKSQLIT